MAVAPAIVAVAPAIVAVAPAIVVALESAMFLVDSAMVVGEPASVKAETSCLGMKVLNVAFDGECLFDQVTSPHLAGGRAAHLAVDHAVVDVKIPTLGQWSLCLDEDHPLQHMDPATSCLETPPLDSNLPDM